MVSSRIVGKAGTGLSDTSWAANAQVARVGKAGELATESLLNELAGISDGPTVLHDLVVPLPGYTANIDHAVVSGQNVVLIDTKNWKSGRYWTFLGRTRVGFKHYEYAEKANPGLGFDSVSAYLAEQGITFKMRQPIIAVRCSSKSGHANVRRVNIPGARVVGGGRAKKVALAAVGKKAADPAIVAALTQLVVSLHPGPYKGPKSRGYVAAIPQQLDLDKQEASAREDQPQRVPVSANAAPAGPPAAAARPSHQSATADPFESWD